MLEDITFWEAIGQLFRNHPIGASLVAGGTILAGVVGTITTVFGYLKKKPNSALENIGDKYGLKVSTWGRKKYGRGKWEKSIEPLLDYTALGGLLHLIKGFRKGLRRDNK